MIDLSRWAQTADTFPMTTPIFIIAIIVCLAVGAAKKSLSSMFLAFLCAIGLLVTPSPHDAKRYGWARRHVLRDA